MDNTFQKKRIHVTKLLLDSENPRHDAINNQPEIINQLLKNDQVINLAKDIAAQGALSPLELVGVLPVDGRDDYIVIEGNRRICACMLLNNPDLAPQKSLSKKFTELQKSNNYPTVIECAVFDNRDDADHWMQLRHEGQQDGIGTKPWDAIQKARYSEKRGRKSPNIQSAKLLDYAADRQIIKDKDKNRYSITTLQRYLNNPIVRNIFGLRNREGLESKQDEQSFKKLVTRFLEDYDSGTVNSRSNQEDWIDYANVLQKEVADTPASENSYTDYTPDPDKKNKDDGKKRERSKQNPANRKHLIPGDIKFSINDKILNRVYWEIRRLSVENHEFSTAYLFRAFVEGTAYLYLKKHIPGMLNSDSRLHNKLKKVSEHLRQHYEIRPGDLKALDIATSDSNSLISPLMLGSMVHMSVIPNKRELIGIWDRMEKILLIMHQYLK